MDLLARLPASLRHFSLGHFLANRFAPREIQESPAGVDVLTLPDDILARIASQLHDPDVLLALALTCKRLQGVVKGAAQLFIERATDEERSNLPRVNLLIPGTEGAFREWGVISKYQQILKHRESLQFDQIAGNVEHRGGDISRLYRKSGSSSYGFGVSNRIMRSGVHKAMFKFGDGAFVLTVGITRPMDYYNENLYEPGLLTLLPRCVAEKYWRAERKINVVTCRESGMVDLYVGRGFQHRNSNAGFNNTDMVGLVLDMEKGALSLYRNGSPGCKIASGLDGEYVWVARGMAIGDDGLVVRISEWD